MKYIGFVLGILTLGFVRPDENTRSTFLMHDGKADAPNSYPGGLQGGLHPRTAELIGLSGTKEQLRGLEGNKGPDDELFLVEKSAAELKAKLDGIKENLSSEMKSYLTKMETNFNQKLASVHYGSAEGTKESVQAAESALMNGYLRKGTIDPDALNRLSNLRGKKDGEPTTYLLSDNTFVVPTFIDKAILQVMQGTSTLLSRVNFVTAGSGYQKIIIRDGQAGRVNESTTRDKQNAPKTSAVQFTGGEIYGLHDVSTWSLDDAGFDIEREFQRAVAESIGAILEAEIVSGGGGDNAEFSGLNGVSAAVHPSFGELRRVSAGDKVTYEDLLNVVLSVPKKYRNSDECAWIMPTSVLASFIGMRDDNDNLVFVPNTNGTPGGVLLGYPVEENEEVASAQDGRIAYFGNLAKGYAVHAVGSSRLIRDPYTRKGFVEFYFAKRVRGSVADTTGISVLMSGTSASS